MAKARYQIQIETADCSLDNLGEPMTNKALAIKCAKNVRGLTDDRGVYVYDVTTEQEVYRRKLNEGAF